MCNQKDENQIPKTEGYNIGKEETYDEKSLRQAKEATKAGIEILEYLEGEIARAKRFVNNAGAEAEKLTPQCREATVLSTLSTNLTNINDVLQIQRDMVNTKYDESDWVKPYKNKVLVQ